MWVAVPNAYDALASVLEEIEAFATSLEPSEAEALNKLYEFAREKEEFCAEANASGQVPNGSRLNNDLSLHRRALVGTLGRLKLEQDDQNVAN